MMASLALCAILRAQIAHEAKSAFPRECCGLIEGYRDGSRIVATRLHAARNVAAEPDRFEIDPGAHVALLKTLRGTQREIIGCYHSHPNGRAEPSARDGGGDDNFVWLIAATSPHGVTVFTAHLRKDNRWHVLALARSGARNAAA
ncbi:MAG TPA: M67 family metallopeptidase [Rhizomicrobium sp.]|jgi:proteasome lid subunit RPN8/RPN11